MKRTRALGVLGVLCGSAAVSHAQCNAGTFTAANDFTNLAANPWVTTAMYVDHLCSHFVLNKHRHLCVVVPHTVGPLPRA